MLAADRYYTPRSMRSGRARHRDSVSGAHADLDLRSTLDLVELVNDEDAACRAGRARGRPPRSQRRSTRSSSGSRGGGRLVYVGAGTSGRLARVDAAECGPTFGVPPEQIVALVAGGARAHAVAQEAAEDDEVEGAQDIAAAQRRPGATQSSRSRRAVRTPYALGAAHAASERRRADGRASSAPDDSKLGRLADHEVVAVVGPEVIAGSTRMKAGTAQKLVLNTISTVTMVRLGQTFGNLMVDVVASNAKLRARARRVVELATERLPGGGRRGAAGSRRRREGRDRLPADRIPDRGRARAARGRGRVDPRAH